MSQFRQFWIYPFKTTKMLFTYLEPNELKKYAPENFDEVHVVEIAALEAAQKEIAELKDELDSLKLKIGIANPYLVKDRLIKQLTAALKVAEDALNKYKDSAFDVDGKVYKVGSKAKEALSEIEKIKKGLG